MSTRPSTSAITQPEDNFVLSCKYRRGSPKPKDYGQFESIINWTVSSDSLNPTKVVGHIFQLIDKNTRVKVKGLKYKGNHDIEYTILPEQILETSSDISNYTSGKVNFMCDKYLEYFAVHNGVGDDGDMYANGTIALYDSSSGQPMADDTKDVSEGFISQIGLSVFIPEQESKKFIDGIPWDPSDHMVCHIYL